MRRLWCEGPACLRHACTLRLTAGRGAGAEYVKEAVQEDTAGNYAKALELYKIALEYFSTHLKYEKNPRARDAIIAKVRCSGFVS